MWSFLHTLRSHCKLWTSRRTGMSKNWLLRRCLTTAPSKDQADEVVTVDRILHHFVLMKLSAPIPKRRQMLPWFSEASGHRKSAHVGPTLSPRATVYHSKLPPPFYSSFPVATAQVFIVRLHCCSGSRLCKAAFTTALCCPVRRGHRHAGGLAHPAFPARWKEMLGALVVAAQRWHGIAAVSRYEVLIC